MSVLCGEDVIAVWKEWRVNRIGCQCCVDGMSVLCV